LERAFTFFLIHSGLRLVAYKKIIFNATHTNILSIQTRLYKPPTEEINGRRAPPTWKTTKRTLNNVVKMYST